MANDQNENNRSNQLNPNNDAYHQSWGNDDKTIIYTNTDSEKNNTNQTDQTHQQMNKPNRR